MSHHQHHHQHSSSSDTLLPLPPSKRLCVDSNRHHDEDYSHNGTTTQSTATAVDRINNLFFNHVLTQHEHSKPIVTSQHLQHFDDTKLQLILENLSAIQSIMETELKSRRETEQQDDRTRTETATATATMTSIKQAASITPPSSSNQINHEDDDDNRITLIIVDNASHAQSSPSSTLFCPLLSCSCDSPSSNIEVLRVISQSGYLTAKELGRLLLLTCQKIRTDLGYPFIWSTLCHLLWKSSIHVPPELIQARGHEWVFRHLLTPTTTTSSSPSNNTSRSHQRPVLRQVSPPILTQSNSKLLISIRHKNTNKEVMSQWVDGTRLKEPTLTSTTNENKNKNHGISLLKELFENGETIVPFDVPLRVGAIKSSSTTATTASLATRLIRRSDLVKNLRAFVYLFRLDTNQCLVLHATTNLETTTDTTNNDNNNQDNDSHKMDIKLDSGNLQLKRPFLQSWVCFETISFPAMLLSSFEDFATNEQEQSPPQGSNIFLHVDSDDDDDDGDGEENNDDNNGANANGNNNGAGAAATRTTRTKLLSFTGMKLQCLGLGNPVPDDYNIFRVGDFLGEREEVAHLLESTSGWS